MSAKNSPKVDKNTEVSYFMKNLWFYLLYFVLLLMMASYGLIAEA